MSASPGSVRSRHGNLSILPCIVEGRQRRWLDKRRPAVNTPEPLAHRFSSLSRTTPVKEVVGLGQKETIFTHCRQL